MKNHSFLNVDGITFWFIELTFLHSIDYTAFFSGVLDSIPLSWVLKQNYINRIHDIIETVQL